MHEQAALVGPKGDQIVLAARGVLTDGEEVVLPESLDEKREGAIASLVGCEIEAAVEVEAPRTLRRRTR